MIAKTVAAAFGGLGGHNLVTCGSVTLTALDDKIVEWNR
jgi:hypothetical protein